MAKTKRRNGYILDPQTAFVAHPDKRGLWVRTHPCVLLVACPETDGCGAKLGEPCRRSRVHHVSKLGRYKAATCWRRRAIAQGKPFEIPPFTVVFVV